MKKDKKEEVRYFLWILGIALGFLATVYVFFWLYFYSPLEGGLWEASLVGFVMIFVFGVITLSKDNLMSTSWFLFGGVLAWGIFFTNVMPMSFQKGGIYSKKEKSFVSNMPFQHPLNWKKDYLVKDLYIPEIYLFGDGVCDLRVVLAMTDSSFFEFVEELLLDNHEAKSYFIKDKISAEIRGLFPDGYCGEMEKEMPKYVKTYYVVAEGGFN